MKHTEIFENSKEKYKNIEKWNNYANPTMLKFALDHCRQTDKVLDIGCATGEYCLKLQERGISCTGIDVNQNYVEIAWKRGVKAYRMDASNLRFGNKDFDVILLFEILEHVQNPEKVLEEARRVARKVILITTPDFSDFEKLKSLKLTYRNCLDLDHKNFFSKSDLESLLSQYFRNFNISQKEPIYVYHLLPGVIRKPLSGLAKLGLLSPQAYNRLYAIVYLDRRRQK